MTHIIELFLFATHPLQMFYTYIIYSPSADRYYTGHTSYTPPQRLLQHNNAYTPSTISGIPWELKFYKSFDNKSDAIRFELFIKRQKSRASWVRHFSG
jgi:putative endonuclease